MSLEDAKAEARKAAFARRAEARSEAAERKANAHLEALLGDLAPGPVSGFWPIRTEIDPRPALIASARPICLPVVVGAGQPLVFRAWAPGAAMVEGAYGAAVPADPVEVTPRIVVVPLAAFDARGMRLGYGGGFYDRTLAGLRARGPVTAVGFAFAGQETDALPVEETDMPLDLIVTEDGVRWFQGPRSG